MKKNKAILILVLVVALFIYLYDSWCAKQASDYFSSCISLPYLPNIKMCECVMDTYYNNQLLRKFGILPKFEECPTTAR